MASPKKRVNPFYPLLVLVGLIFACTACGYGALMVNVLQPERAALIREEGLGFLGWMDRYGMWIMSIELGLLALLTFAAIGTDEYWSGNAESQDNPSRSSP
jgi:hypothetical protein